MKHGEIVLPKCVVSPENPSSKYIKIYAKSDGILYWKDSSGTESPLASTGSVGNIQDYLTGYVTTSQLSNLQNSLSGYSQTNHTHDQYFLNSLSGSFSLSGHNHDGTYATVESVTDISNSLSGYSQTNHTHDQYFLNSLSGSFSLSGHNHDGTYATVESVTDISNSLSGYSQINHTHDQYFLNSLSGSFSLSGHTHAQYALDSDLTQLSSYVSTLTGSTSATMTGYPSADDIASTDNNKPLVATYSQTGIDEYTKGLFHFDGSDGSTTLSDSISNLILTAQSTCQLDTSYKKYGTASLLFNGSSDYASFTDNSDLDLGLSDEPFTIEIFARTTKTDVNHVQQYISRGGSVNSWSDMTNGQYYLCQLQYGSGSNATIYFYFNKNGTTSYASASCVGISDGNFHHIAIAYDGTTTRVFYDGNVGGVTTNDHYYKPTSANRCYLGVYAVPAAGSYQNGHTDELRITKGICRWTSSFTPPIEAYGVEVKTFAKSTLTPSELVATDANGGLQSLPVATYPSLTELSYLKGVSGAIQTQLNAKIGATADILQIRISAHSTNPVGDATGASNLYFYPFNGNGLSLWDGSSWIVSTVTATSLSVGSLTQSKNYDVFAYLSSGNPAYEFLVWTNDTTRATDWNWTDGVATKVGDKTRRLIGTIRIDSGASTITDSTVIRGVSNFDKRGQIKKNVVSSNSTASWSYTTGSWREYNNGTGQTKGYFVLSNGNIFEGRLNTHFVVTGTAETGLVVDATSYSNALANIQKVGNAINIKKEFTQTISAGYHYITEIEYGSTGATFYGGSTNDAYMILDC